MVTNHTVISGNQTWRGRVHYDKGVQPKGSKGTEFDAPYDAGVTGYINRTITGVYPSFATSSDITTLTKQTLVSMSSTYVQFSMVAEDGTNKQKVALPDAWSTITGIMFFNTVSNTWEWINGSKANSLLTFTVTTDTIEIQGSTINYDIFTHNGSTIGARLLRFYTN